MLKHIPNILTVIRFLLIPLIVILIFQGNFVWAIIFLLISAITDILDGIIARHFNLITDFGKLMDPLADKITQISMLIVLTIQDIIPLWVLLVVLSEQLFMIAGAGFLYRNGVVMHSKWYGKVGTVLFDLAILCSLFIKYWNSIIVAKYNLFILPSFDRYLYYATIVCAVFSFIMYLRSFYFKEYLKKK